MKRPIAVMFVAYVLIIMTGCYSVTTNKRDSMLADVRVSKRAVEQSADQLQQIIEVKDRDIKKFAPAYAHLNNKTPEDLQSTLEVSDEVTRRSNLYIKDLRNAANILGILERDLGGM